MGDDWIQTYTGRRFHPLQPRPEMVCIEDIAHALALKCRWTGHARSFYSIAEHSVRVSWAIRSDRQTVLFGLLHDAAEAYLADVARPVKRHLHTALPDDHLVSFAEAEERLLAVIHQALGLPAIETIPGAARAVRLADDVLLATEARDLMGGIEGWEWTPPRPLDEGIETWTWQESERRFLERWEELRG